MELSQPLPDKKVNGFSNGLHSLQVFAYLAFSAAVAVFTICVFPFLDTASQIVSGLLYYMSIGAMAILAAYCSYSDPTDPVIYSERNAKLKNQEFDASEYEYYCNTCTSHVQNGSKHCRQCERCVNDFDHHCKWLNNCIGKQNYRAFLGLISLVFINSCVFCVFMVYALDTKYGNNLQSELFVDVSETQYLVYKITVWVFLVLVGILGVLDFNLLLFHIWLSSHKLTTYEYIINSRQAQQENRPYGICAGVDDRSSQDKQVPKKLDEHSREPSQTSLQTSISTQQNQAKYCCCLWRKKENSVSPIILGQEGFNEAELRKHDSLGRHRPFGQNVIEGLIEKSICNSADVREDEMLTEICKQEQQQLDDVELKSGNVVLPNIMGMARLTEGGGSGMKQQTFAGAESQMSSEFKLHEKKLTGLVGGQKQLKNRNPILIDREVEQEEEERSPFEKLSLKNKGNSEQDNSGKNKMIFSQNLQLKEPFPGTQKNRNKDQTSIINPFLISPPRGVASAGEVDEILMDEDANSNKLIQGSPCPSTNQLVKSSDNTRLSLSKLNHSDSDYTQINPNKHSFENSKAYQNNNYNNNTHFYPEKDSPQLESINKTPSMTLNKIRQLNQIETSSENKTIGLPASISNHSREKKQDFNIFLQPPSNQSQKRLVTNSPSKERLIQQENGVVSMEDIGDKQQHDHQSQGESEKNNASREENTQNKVNSHPDDNLFGGLSNLKFDSFDPEVDIAQSA